MIACLQILILGIVIGKERREEEKRVILIGEGVGEEEALEVKI